MAKDRSFAAKVAKASGKRADQCPVCKGPISHVLFVKSVLSNRTGSWRFNEGHIRVCKCNQQEVYG
ncbi:MAG: hypothetical protein ACE5OR_08945 [bacterium]